MTAEPELEHLPDPGDPGRSRPWFVLPESPGGLGDPQVWVDEAMLEHLACGASRDGGLLGARVCIGHRWTGRDDAVCYVAVLRRTGPGTVNLGRPYYVLQWPD